MAGIDTTQPFGQSGAVAGADTFAVSVTLKWQAMLLHQGKSVPC
jgi:hypothetical protein